jgi:hypothetical protein
MEIPEKVFLCWSKCRSKAIAEAWERLLPEIIQGVQPVLSTEFQKGKEWSKELRWDLDQARTGIVFLTPENVDAPWIHFEARVPWRRRWGIAMETCLRTFMGSIRAVWRVH